MLCQTYRVREIQQVKTLYFRYLEKLGGDAAARALLSFFASPAVSKASLPLPPVRHEGTDDYPRK